MLQDVDVGERSLSAYREVMPEAVIDELLATAEGLQGARVLHINATPYGGGVSELLRSVIPLLNDLGMIADWKIISGDERFFSVTKTIHNGLQGADRGLDVRERESYLSAGRDNAAQLEEQYDFVFIHDPQPAALLALHGKSDARWIWRCHIDTSGPNPDVWAFLRSFLADYDAAVYTLPEFVAPDLPVRHVEVIPPAIDPLSPKNMPLGPETVRSVLEWIGVRTDRPLVTQISRFDPWKDPAGVLAAYRSAREEKPGLQLVLAGSMALDDPEGWQIYREVATEAAEDPQIHVFTNLTGVGNVEVNALQRLADVVIQKSLREGFGLVVSEAMWKETPVVAGRAGGIPLQMADGAGGLLVDDVAECAAAIVRLLTDRALASELAAGGRQRVQEHFLMPRLILNELSLMLELARQHPLGPTSLPPGASRDPVCGMAIQGNAPSPQLQFERDTFRFCSEACLARFQAEPERYFHAQL